MLKKLVILLMVLILPVLAGCGGAKSDKVEGNKDPGTVNEQPAAKDTIKFAYIVMPQAAPQALLNQEEKIFEAQLQKLGKKVEIIATRSLDSIWPMMDSDKDDPDFVYIPTANFATYITETSKFGGSNKYSIIAGSVNTNTTVLIARPGIESLKDLDGKKVGLANLRYSDEFQFNKMLSAVGLSTKSMGGTVDVIYDDIVLKLMDNFGKGDYDAVIMYDPMNFKTTLDKVAGSKILTTLNPDKLFGDKQPRSWLVAKKNLLKNDPELVAEVLKAHITSTDKAKENIEKLPPINREVFINYYKEKNAELTEILKTHTLEFYQKKWQEADITYDPNLGYVNEVFQFMDKKGVVKGKTIDDFIQIEFLNKALKELGRDTIKS